MAKTTKSKKPSATGKGKVTPIQVAFIVDRFLADNSYENTLAAFRSEASDLFSKTKGKEVPKGLLGLGDILDEYITLKEQRVMVDQEKRRLETAFQGFQDVMGAYNSPQSPMSLPPQVSMAPSWDFHQGADPNNGSPPQGHTIHRSFVNHAQPTIMPPRVDEINKYSTPVPSKSSSEKRKASRSAPKAPPPPKKYRIGSAKDPHMIEDIVSTGEAPSTNNTQVKMGNDSVINSISRSISRPPVQGSSVAKNLFKNQHEARANSSSPKTPPRALLSQNGKSLSPVENSSFNPNGASSSHKNVPSSCAIISSETIVISPLKQKGYFSVERSYQVSASPLKPSPEKVNKRDHVKGRLDFDEASAPQSSEEQAATESSPSTDGEAAGSFDFDLPDFDFFDGDFTKLLCDIDLDCEQVHTSQQSSAPVDFLPGECNQEENVGNGGLATNTVTEIFSQKDMNIQGLDTMTTMRSITKRIMISSPSKGSNSSA
ncbi:uncharacterized protein A4U43_C05F2660 [Asparagus officinalis]|uniref:LisH domain-containing protein n=1 Tax=Asparagus officinalis TaxID=4686 RepID=A0A5P1EPG8_ASPOF|nr:uncharacterized protein LOC109843525 [Asparagus officinalis]ONK67684.1 uncharacterized protein A4U43_C05F2660 [Asparagus officinalis]